MDERESKREMKPEGPWLLRVPLQVPAVMEKFALFKSNNLSESVCVTAGEASGCTAAFLTAYSRH